MTTRRANPAFTIIELLTVVVILGVVAGLTLPRLVGDASRRTQRELDAVAALLASAAKRESTSSTPVALVFEDDVLRVRMLRAPEEFSPWSGHGTWIDDPLTPSVRLQLLELSTASASGVTLAEREWRIDLSTLEVRPAVALGLTSSDGRDWVAYLAPDADRATVHELTAGVSAESIEPDVVDLDLSGREEDPW